MIVADTNLLIYLYVQEEREVKRPLSDSLSFLRDAGHSWQCFLTPTHSSLIAP